MTPEEKARQQIDAMLVASGWAVQTKEKINLFAQRGVALCELTFKTGEPDYTLFVEGKAIGTIEAKPAGTTLTGVEEQSAKYELQPGRHAGSPVSATAPGGVGTDCGGSRAAIERAGRVGVGRRVARRRLAVTPTIHPSQSIQRGAGV